MAERQQSKLHLHCGQYLGEISALYFLLPPSGLSFLPFLIAGSGSQILLYELETGQMIRSFHVFEGIRVHGITCSSVICNEGSLSVKLAYKLAVFGEKRVKLFSLNVEVALTSEAQSEVLVDLNFVHSLPRFNNWVLDVCFLKGCQEEDCLAIGCSDNSVFCWNISESSVILEVQSPDRCLLYSMRLWGDNLEHLHIASGTIYNEIIVWKVVSVCGTLEDQTKLNTSCSNSSSLYFKQYEAVHICRLVGHEGSIFRIEWSSDGSKLVSVSDDRSARIWTIDVERKYSDNLEEDVGQVLFGHNARVWDCCISDSLIVTAGEDCTCRVWGLDGKQLKMIKEHIGRGIWRCLYDQKSSLLVTAGFDSAIKVHLVHKSLSEKLDEYTEENEFIERTELSTIHIPNSSECFGPMDSKSEYVRCLRFSCEDTIYVATNHGYLYCAQLSNTGNVKWTKLVHIKEGGPIVCMELLSRNTPGYSCSLDDWVALGDGKGNMTVVRVTYDAYTTKVGYELTWSAGPERQLLGTFWCRSLGYRYVFTADPRGILKLWRLSDPVASVSCDSSKTCDVSLIAEFSSCFGARIMCLDALVEEEVLVCGDLRGNLVLFPLLKDLLTGMPSALGVKITPINYFKGAHGISNVSSLSFGRLSSSKIEICSVW
ncbi:WD repeat-containing protein 6 [Carica papaya]|uniref:WD repeat-containing protein 6 n=1 Tax=Carica papaya TaxID=3649 RepID=UPI000B8CAF73|nr:WD repeat-containing protein 6 [Carica papaya]